MNKNSLNYLTLDEKKAFVLQDTLIYLRMDLCKALEECYNEIAGIRTVDELRSIVKNIGEIYSNARFVKKTKKYDLEYREIDKATIWQFIYEKSDLKAQAHEVALFAILCAYFEVLNLDYVVGITTDKQDGGVDITVSRTSGGKPILCEFMFDVKSRKNTTDKHVKWKNVKGKYKYLIHVVAEGSDGLGQRKNLENMNEKRFVFDLSLKHQIRNLAAVIGWQKETAQIDLLEIKLKECLNKIQ